MLVVLDTVPDAVKVFENVLAKLLGLSCVPVRVRVVLPLVGGANKDDIERESETEDVDEMVDPALLFAGEEGREP